MDPEIQNERDKALLDILVTSIHSRTDSLVGAGAIAAALLVVATFKKEDLAKGTKMLLTLLLFTIAFSIGSFWIRREYEVLDSSKELGLWGDKKHVFMDKSWLRWVAGGSHLFTALLILISLVWMLYFIWAG